MSYNKGQSQFGSLPSSGNLWAMIRQLVAGQGSINPSDQAGAGGLQTVKATYDFSVDGGAIGTIQPVNSPIIPAGAVILSGMIHIVTTLTSGGAATVAIGIGTAAQTAAIKAATGFASYVGGSLLAPLPDWTTGGFIVAADGKITFTVAAATVTAGKIDAHIIFMMAGE